jgi:hypothetical protein
MDLKDAMQFNSEQAVKAAKASVITTEDGQTFMLFPRGTPDLCGFVHKTGQMFFIEVKKENGRLRPDQVKFAKFIAQFPVIYGVARSVDDALKIVGDNNA